MSLSWMICINMLIGIPVYFITTIAVMLIFYKIFGEKIVDEALDNIKKESDNVYRTLVDDPRKMYVVSFILTFLLWEITLPMLDAMLFNSCKELKRIHNEEGS